MNKTLLVAKNEFVNTVMRPGFLIALLAVPLFSAAIMWVSMGGFAGSSTPVAQVFTGAQQVTVEGLVDESGLIQTVPADLSERFTLFADAEQAAQAVREGRIASYYLIPADYVQSGKVFSYRPDFNPMGGTMDSSDLERLLSASLVPDQPALAERSVNLVNRTREQVTVEETVDRDSFIAFILPYVVTIVLYATIFGSSQYMLNSITVEKQNRVVELLMTSVTPEQLMTGKILALGLAGLIQTVVWFGFGYAAYAFFGQSGIDMRGVNLGAGFILSMLVYFVLGYLLYASLMAAIGALVSNVKEASQVTFMLVMPLVVPMMFISEIASNPNGFFTVFLSLFPLTSVVTMPSRMAIAQVPLWQIAASAILLVGTLWLVFKGTANIFRAQNLLTGKQVSIKAFLLALAGRV